ncbi:MAG: hypothetical protein LBE99_01675 [Puniceicoccales bacterium]|jgi:uncharacterized protein YllA (UPF0747 family)|nr:hypothetical protein [Puniceicoccales bacterium]
MDLGVRAIGCKNNPQKLVNIEKQFLSNGIDYLTSRMNPPIDSQQAKQLLVISDTFAKMANIMVPTGEPQWPCKSKDDVLKNVQFNFFQHITRLPLLVKEIDKGVERSDENHLQHALKEFQSVTARMIPMLDLAQTRIERMPLDELNKAGSEIISSSALDTDANHGITQEMRQQAGGTD